jgi:hypothetical protein
MEEDRRFSNRLMKVLCEEWDKVNPDPWDTVNLNTLRSDTIYERLVNEGTEVPDDAMYEVIEDLKAGALIRATYIQNRDARHQHGNWTITWVDYDGLCDLLS